MKDLFNNSKLNVTQGKKMQRKIRYEKLKTEFHSLILSLAVPHLQSHAVNSHNQSLYQPSDYDTLKS
jgi:hypothetical protein